MIDVTMMLSSRPRPPAHFAPIVFRDQKKSGNHPGVDA
jgi:hypothetical protein